MARYRITSDVYSTIQIDPNSYYLLADTSELYKGSTLLNVPFQQYQPEPESPYLCITAIEDTEIMFTYGMEPPDVELEYSFDGTNWNEYEMYPDHEIHVSAGGKCYWKNNLGTFNTNSDKLYFRSSGKVKAGGNILSLINNQPLSEYCFAGLFAGCINLVEAPKLPSIVLVAHCYESMFSETGITEAPELPATTLADYCYDDMFSYCPNLIAPPKLPATELAKSCYSFMFDNCESISKVPELPAITLKDECYKCMFQNCPQIFMSSTQTGDYQTPYRIPYDGMGTTAFIAMLNMFFGTGGTFTDDPKINTTYYTKNEII